MTMCYCVGYGSGARLKPHEYGADKCLMYPKFPAAEPEYPMIAMTPERIDAVTRLLRKSVRKIDPHFDHEQIVEDLLAEARREQSNA